METETLTISEIEKLLWQSPASKELLVQRQREDERARLAAEIVALHEEQERELPPLKLAVDKAAAEVEEARRTLKQKEIELRGKVSAHSAVSSRLAAWIARDENALRRSANPAIDEFVVFSRRSIDNALNSFSSIPIPTGERAFESGRPIVEQKSNADTIARTVRALEAAIKAAEKLKLRAITDEEVAMELQKLAETLPGEGKQEALVWLEDRGLGYDLVISERSELVRQSEPWKNRKAQIRASLGIGSSRPRYR